MGKASRGCQYHLLGQVSATCVYSALSAAVAQSGPGPHSCNNCYRPHHARYSHEGNHDSRTDWYGTEHCVSREHNPSKLSDIFHKHGDIVGRHVGTAISFLSFSVPLLDSVGYPPVILPSHIYSTSALPKTYLATHMLTI